MDYEQLSVQELREACQARGLGTARSKAELIQRLTDHDSKQDVEAVTKLVIPAADMQDQRITPEPVAPATVFRKAFPAEPGGPDEETHLAYRQATIQAAVDAGHAARGDARLAETSDGMWVYEVLVRQADLT